MIDVEGRLAAVETTLFELVEEIGSPWLTPQQAARRAGLSARTIETARAAGKLPAYLVEVGDGSRSRRRWRFHVVDVDRWLLGLPPAPASELIGLTTPRRRFAPN